MSITIVMPPTASSDKDLDLIKLTEYIWEKFHPNKPYASGLGGEYAYGVDYGNDVFLMHRFCWCEEEDCPWCGFDAPNFLHIPSGLQIHWYKWIGRGMEYNQKISDDQWREIFHHCVQSVEEDNRELD